MKWLKKISNNFFLQLITMLGCFMVLLAGIFIFLHIYTASLSSKMNTPSQEFYKLTYIESKPYLLNTESNRKTPINEDVIKGQSFERILNQLNELKRRTKAHYRTMIFFFKQQYIFNLMQAFMILVTTIFMLVVSKYGWDNVDRILLMAFFVCGGFVAFFNVVPDTLKIKENIRNNKKYVVTYENAETSVLTYISTGENKDGEKIETKTYVHMLDEELRKHNVISFDLDEIPDQNFQFDKK